MVEIRVIASQWMVALLLSSPFVASAQSARVAGLETNPQYIALQAQEQRLNGTEDSIVRIIDQTRRLFSTQPAQREVHGAEILRLESELFEVRNSLGVVASKIGELEQEYVLSNLDSGVSSPATPAAAALNPAQRRSNLVYNAVFKDHLSSADYSALLRAQQLEELAPEIVASYCSNYHQIDSLAKIYLKGESVVAQEAGSKLKPLQSINTLLADSLQSVWGYVFDNKSYAYSYMMDKMNQSDLLTRFEDSFQEVNQQVASVRDAVASEEVYAYALRKKLILDYEVALAEQLGCTQALDSLRSVLTHFDLEQLQLPKIEIPTRNFIDYSPISVTHPSIYNGSNPIPEAQIYPNGTVYRIQVGTFSRKQAVSIFRFASPISYEALPDGRYRYCLGGFHTLVEAQDAWVQMKKIGFYRPEIVVWRNGEYENLGAPTPDELKNQHYRVEISGDGEVMSPLVKEVLENSAPEKEVSRAVGEEGNFLYTVGTFESRADAETLIGLLEQINGISAQLLVIGR